MKKTILKKIRGRYYPTIIEEETTVEVLPEIKILELKNSLKETDYVDNKITEAIARYLVSKDDTEFKALLNEYSTVLEKRKEWRREINELS